MVKPILQLWLSILNDQCLYISVVYQTIVQRNYIFFTSSIIYISTLFCYDNEPRQNLPNSMLIMTISISSIIFKIRNKNPYATLSIHMLILSGTYKEGYEATCVKT